MNIPKLNRSNRSREYMQYNQVIIDNIVYDYLFYGLSHRKLDEKYTNMDSSYSRGYQSMGILHYLGLRNDFKGIFINHNITDTITVLKNTNDNHYIQIIEILNRINLYEIEELSEATYLAEAETNYEVSEYTTNTEGRRVVYYTTRYERNPRNRAAAIAIHGCKCMVCGFNFEKTYGSWGKGYIEVHHIKPLYYLNEEIEINPATDLVTVCSNCHRMIHRKKNIVLSIEELKEKLRTK